MPSSLVLLFSPFSLSLVVMVMTMTMMAAPAVVDACTDILVTPGASADGSAMVAYNADSPTLYGVLYHYPAASASATMNNSNNNTTNSDTTIYTTDSGGRVMRKVYDWDSGKLLGEIDWGDAVANSAANGNNNGTTYNVVGNGNDRGLVIGESTFGGASKLSRNSQSGAVVDYGSLIYMTLQTCRTAREAIRFMVDLVGRYGYASGGESFSIADGDGEVWMMEMISTGSSYAPRKKGAVWVAVKIPDGSVAAHANHARITTFPRDDPDNCLYAEDVVDVAVHYELYPADADPLHFSFSDAYDPLDFVGARQGEARVYSVFSKIADAGGNFSQTYERYALGIDLKNRMPLYVEPFQKLSVLDVMGLMNSHYEDEPAFDSSKDVGAGLFKSPYRPRPLVWTHNKTKYHNERSIATAKTGWNFVAQVRPRPFPPEMSALIWWAADDSSTSPRVPVYASSTRVSRPYGGRGSQDGVKTPLLEFDIAKAFWVQNMVSNFAYSRWCDVYPVLRAKIDGLQKDLLRKTKLVDEIALRIHETKGSEAAVKYLTMFSVNVQSKVHQLWFEFYGKLFARFRDYYTITAEPDEPVCGCVAREPGLSEAVKKRIVEEAGDRYKVENGGGDQPDFRAAARTEMAL